jgi:glycerol-3-phosphate cytidylyltransferase
MIYCFDIDGTICDTNGNDYRNALPFEEVLREINRLYDEGNYIKFFTARGTSSGIDWTNFTTTQLETWGVRYHELIMNIKPSFDIMVDDRAVDAAVWRKQLSPKVGFLAGSFDLIHPGYILMFKDAKRVCDYLIVGLQTDPTIDRTYKNKPVQTFEERKMILSGIQYVDEIKKYETESDLYNLLKNTHIDVRILGSEYKNSQINGGDLNIPIHFHQRDHNWSTSKLKNLIKENT